MRGITTAITLLAKLGRRQGKSMWPVPVDQLEELAEYLQRVDRLVTAVESFDACVVDNAMLGDVWSDDEVEGLTYVRRALREVRS